MPPNLIARGLVLDRRFRVAFLRKIESGTASAADILSLFRKGAGIWWFVLGPGEDQWGIEDARSFAYAEEHLGGSYGRATYEGALADGAKTCLAEIPVVLVGYRPRGWRPDDNPSRGLDGNSWIDRRRWPTVKLVEIQYFTGTRWVSIKTFARVRV